MKRIKPMLPTLVSDIPLGEGWHYETKYDGFRTILSIETDSIDLYSRNLRSLKEQFPEVVSAAEKIQYRYSTQLPLLLDGELCVLESVTKADFSKIQKRGRLKNVMKINDMANICPAKFLVFDLLLQNKTSYLNEPFILRKEKLEQWMNQVEIPEVSIDHQSSIQWIRSFQDGKALFKDIKDHHGEGIVAKRDNSTWIAGKRTLDWLKIKNLYHGTFIVTGYDVKNGYVHVGVLSDQQRLIPMGLFSHGLEEKEREALVQIIKSNQRRKSGSLIEVIPRICVELEYLELYAQQLRQPRFVKFRLDKDWEDCTWEALQSQMDN